MSLLEAVKQKNIDACHRLLTKNNMNSTNDRGDTLLYMAVQNSCIEIVKMLIEVGADVDKADKGGRTPLYWAAFNGRTEIAKMLIEAKADVNKANIYGQTLLYRAVWHDYTEIVKMLIKAGADVNKANKCGETPLQLAAKEEHLDIMTMLLCEKPTRVKELKDLPEDSEDLIKEYLRSNSKKSAR